MKEASHELPTLRSRVPGRVSGQTVDKVKRVSTMSEEQRKAVGIRHQTAVGDSQRATAGHGPIDRGRRDQTRVRARAVSDCSTIARRGPTQSTSSGWRILDGTHCAVALLYGSGAQRDNDAALPAVVLRRQLR